MSGIEHLLTVAHEYAALEGVALSTVSTRVLKDGKKLSAIEDGADIQVRRLERAMQWFSDHWPGSDWPSGVPRPSPSVAEARA
jgi:hypothetical protein